MTIVLWGGAVESVLLPLPFLVGTGFANENWEVARIGRVDYVTLESFKKFYDLKGPTVVDPEKSLT